ncbi:hypothetical protein LCGC14_1361920 [marine sediment metagenome]|uniref:Uncharacterized protein n=1 Tax=marine sediment metagenome TaxID=412755 RepID=A0A0F9MN95_9ZZZZ
MTELQGWLLLAVLMVLAASQVDEGPSAFFVLLAVGLVVAGVLRAAGLF